MSNEILVIGNGFDLAHGMKTTYNDFIDYIKGNVYKKDELLTKDEIRELNKIKRNNGFIKYFVNLLITVPGWVDFEREIYSITTQFSHFFENTKELMLSNNKVSQKNAGKLLIDILSSFGIAEIKDLAVVIKPEYYSNKYGINKREILNTLKCQLNELIRALELYLDICQRKFQKESKGEERIINQIKRINPKYIVTFNYTDTYKLYEFSQCIVKHIHGKINEKNIVLGVDDKTPRNLDFIYFKKYFQRIQKYTDEVDWIDLSDLKTQGRMQPTI